MALNVPAVHVAAVDLVCVDFAACPVALLSISSQASTTISRHGPAHPASSAGTSRPSAACIIATNIAPPDLRGQRRAGFGMNDRCILKPLSVRTTTVSGSSFISLQSRPQCTGRPMNLVAIMRSPISTSNACLSKDGRLAVAQRQVYVAFSGKRRLPIRRLTVQALRITRLFRGDCAWTEFPNPSLDGLSIAFGTAS